MTAAFLVLAAYASWVDARERRLPNRALAAMAALALLGQALRLLGSGALAWAPLWQRLVRALPAPGVCVAGAVVVTGVALAAELLWRRRHGSPGFGMGDVKLLGCWSLAVGPVLAVAGLAVGCAVGAVAALVRRRATFALGPWVNAACAVVSVAACCAPGLLWS